MDALLTRHHSAGLLINYLLFRISVPVQTLVRILVYILPNFPLPTYFASQAHLQKAAGACYKCYE